MKELPLIQPAPEPVDDACADGCCSDGDAGATVVEVDDPTPFGDGVRTVFSIEGMDCASCAITLERSVRAVAGVHRANVNFAAARLDVLHEDDLEVVQVERAVERAGFRALAPGAADGPSYWRSNRARLVMAAAIAYVLGLGALLLPDVPATVTTTAFVLAILLAGGPIFRAALTALRARHMDMNVLMSAATVGAAILGEWAEAASVVVLFGVGNALQAHAMSRTRDAVRALARLAPGEVLVLDGDEQRAVAVAAVDAGQRVVVRPGDRIALDGRIVEGRSSVDESSITGESLPVPKEVGDDVRSGSLNADGALVVEVTRPARDSTIQHVVRLVEQAQATRAPTEQFVDRFSRVYTPLVVLAAAILVVLPPLLGGDWSTWFYRGLALLIIACPCSLVISTPVTVVSAIGAASRRGVLVKGGEALEATGRLRALALDKTGTLTEGRPVVSSILVARGVSQDDALRLAAAVERRSEHPLAHAILAAAAGHEVPNPSEFTSVPGRGATALVDGRRLAVGSPRLLAELGIALDDMRTELAAVHAAGETPVVLADETRVLAVFGLADAVRPEARRAVDRLRALGLHLVMLTGDSEPAARRVAEELGLEHAAELLPQDKLGKIAELRARHGTVGMVGDGVNDAPALAAASVSFAMGAAGSDVALESADVALMGDDLMHVVRAVELSRAAERTIRQNVAISLAVKGVFVVLAPFGLVTLWLAVLADLGTSLLVTGNGLRMARHGSVRRRASERSLQRVSEPSRST